MGITLNSTQIKYKNPNGDNYIPIGIAIANVEETIAQITAEGTRWENAVTTEGNRQIDLINNAVSGGGSVSIGCVTPEQYDAVGDGVHDDGPALKAALESGKKVLLQKDLYVFSPLTVRDHNVILDGNGFNIIVDLAGQSVGWDNPFAVQFTADPLPAGETGPLKMITSDLRESIAEHRGVNLDGTDTYTYGYLSYRGAEPMPAWFLEKLQTADTITETYYPAYRADIRNVAFHFRNCTGKIGLRLNMLVDSVLDNVKSICDEGFDGMEGIQLHGCCDVLCNNIWVENWCHLDAWRSMGVNGYGMALAGDNIHVTNFHGKNNRDHIAGGGDVNKFWSSRLYVNGAYLETDYQAVVKDRRPSGYFLDGFESHGHNYMVNYQNITFIKYNVPDGYNFDALFELRTPYAFVSNVDIVGKGVIVFPPEFTEYNHISHLVAPDADLRCYHGENWQKVSFGKEMILDNCVLASVSNFISGTTLKLVNCVILDRIQQCSHLVMVNTKVPCQTDWTVLSPIEVLEDAQIVNCEIWHNAAKLTPATVPLIKAPANSVQAMNNRFKVMPGGTVFLNEQLEMNNVTEHRYGLILTSDYAALDEYYPFENKGGNT